MRGYFIRFIAFLSLYFLAIFAHPPLTAALYGYRITYNNISQILVFPALLILLSIVFWKKIQSFTTYRQNWYVTFWWSFMALLFVFLPLPPWFVSEYHWLISSYSVVLTVIIFFGLLAIFPMPLIERFKWEIGILMSLIPLSILLLDIIDVFSKSITKPVVFILSVLLPRIFPSSTVNLDSGIIKLNSFAVVIGPPCAGIISLLTFTTLFGFAIFILRRWYGIKRIPTLLSFTGGFLMVFSFNIVRIITIISIGAFYSSDLALTLFHEFFAAIVMVGFFILYLYKIFPRLIMKKPLMILSPASGIAAS